MSRIFVTGGSGFVGAHVVRRLVSDGHDVTVFAPAPEPCLTGPDLATITFVEGAVEEPGALDAMIGSAKPEIAVGLAAYGEGGRGLVAAAAEGETRALAVNVQGFRNLLAASERHRVGRVLWASTLSVYGDPRHYPGGVADEDAPLLPETFYGLTKQLAEVLARYFRDERALAVTGLRLPVVFGPGLWYRGAASGIVDLFRAAAEGGRADLEVPRTPLELMYVKDVARAFALLAAHQGPLDLVYNLRAYAPSLHELVAILKRLRPGLVVDETDIDAPLAFPLMDGRRLEAATGFSPDFPLERACADYIEDLISGS